MNKTCFDPSLPIQTKDERQAKIYETRPDGTISVFVQKYRHSLEWVLRIFNADGTTCNVHRLQEFSSPNDLMNVPPKKKRKEGWVNIYKCYRYDKNMRGYRVLARVTNAYETAAKAKEAARFAATNKVPGYLRTVKIEWEEEE